ncbi:MAG: glycosyltransferase [Bacteroidetes bacterium]|nr:glycosyltransferase [Bacteroidota bacterium]
MKILFVSKTLPHTFQGGIQTHVWKLTEWLLKFGHEINILTAGSHKNGLRTVDMGGRSIIELPYLPGRRMPLVSTAAEELSFNRAARKWLIENQGQFDIIHLQGRSGSLFLSDKKWVKTPVVSTFHGLIANEQDKAIGKQESFDQKIHRLTATRMENMSLRNADALIAVSDEMQAEIQLRMAGLTCKTHQIYNGIDVPETLTTKPADPNLLVFVGRLTALKGVFPLVEAMKNVNNEIRLVMIGDGDARPELEKIIQQNNLQGRIQLTGSLDSKGVNAWVERSSALVLPSYHETQGIVLMEANALGKPVIATAVGGVPEVVKNRKNGLLLGNHEPETIAWGINYTFENELFAVQWGRWGRFYMQEKFSWEKIARQTEALYAKIERPSVTVQEAITNLVHSNI